MVVVVVPWLRDKNCKQYMGLLEEALVYGRVEVLGIEKAQNVACGSLVPFRLQEGCKFNHQAPC